MLGKLMAVFRKDHIGGTDAVVQDGAVVEDGVVEVTRVEVCGEAKTVGRDQGVADVLDGPVHDGPEETEPDVVEYGDETVGAGQEGFQDGPVHDTALDDEVGFEEEESDEGCGAETLAAAPGGEGNGGDATEGGEKVGGEELVGGETHATEVGRGIGP